MVAIISSAFVIFFGDWMEHLMSINQVVLLLLVQGIYMIIRWYMKGCVENRGYKKTEDIAISDILYNKNNALNKQKNNLK